MDGRGIKVVGLGARVLGLVTWGVSENWGYLILGSL